MDSAAVPVLTPARVTEIIAEVAFVIAVLAFLISMVRR
jgi:hypothetical protein